MCHENKISRRRGSDLQKTKLVLPLIPSNLSVVLKVKANQIIITSAGWKSSLQKNASLFSRKSSLDFFISLYFCIVVICVNSELRRLFQIYGPLIEIEHLLVIILQIGCTQLSSQNQKDKNEADFETLKEKYLEQFLH